METDTVLTTQQQMQLIDWFFSANGSHPEVCQDQHNLDLISAFIREHTSGMGKLNRASLEWAVQSLTGKLHLYQHVDVSARLQAGEEAQQQLAVERDEKQRKAEILRKQMERQALQDASGPGRASAFRGQAETQAREAQERKAAQDAATLTQQHADFLSKLRDIEVFTITNFHGTSWAKTYDARRAKRAELGRLYPTFAHELPKD